MQLFYHPEISERIVLSEEESQHCVKVLRYTSGDAIKIIDGKGSLFEGRIDEAAPKNCSVNQIILLKKNERKAEIHIAITPVKQRERMEWFVEKATEIGVSKITFIRTERSEKTNLNLDRFHKKALTAIKQSQNLWLPEINPMVDLEDFLSQNSNEEKYIAHITDPSNTTLLGTITPASTDRLLLIGPEGGFSPEEINKTRKKGFLEVGLGQNILRTETAGIVGTVLLLSHSHS